MRRTSNDEFSDLGRLAMSSLIVPLFFKSMTHLRCAKPWVPGAVKLFSNLYPICNRLSDRVPRNARPGNPLRSEILLDAIMNSNLRIPLLSRLNPVGQMVCRWWNANPIGLGRRP